MAVFNAPEFDDHEQIVFCRDPEAGLKAIIAIHDTALGPALGGCRMWPYGSEEEALTDVLRLSRSMTYKHALAATGQGGGKAVIIGDPKRDKTPALLHAFGRFVDTLGGRYVVAEDVGTSVDDMTYVRRVTRHVAGLAQGGSGDPSPVTAYGVFCGIKAAVRHKFGRDDLAGVRVAVQGLGHVGSALCGYLHEAGARLYVADIDADAVKGAVDAYAAAAVRSEEIADLAVDVFAPCALGGVLNSESIPRIQAPIVAGAANNQLACAGDGLALAERGILYAPDYAINAGGVINITFESGRYDRDAAMRRTAEIYDTLLEIFRRADAEGLPTNVVADRMALERIEAARAKTAAKPG
ncbi:MAG: Glu/Leu/Phe/Val dehydrogenase dimerization domain-containing protein [Alphaproteobacteria bacterium]